MNVGHNFQPSRLSLQNLSNSLKWLSFDCKGNQINIMSSDNSKYTSIVVRNIPVDGKMLVWYMPRLLNRHEFGRLFYICKMVTCNLLAVFKLLPCDILAFVEWIFRAISCTMSKKYFCVRTNCQSMNFD